MKNMKKILSLLFSLVLMLGLCLSVNVSAEDSTTYTVTGDKTITVNNVSSDDYTKNTGIQDAIIYINSQSEKTGWTINVSAGTYTKFVVPSGLSDLSIIGESEDSVFINTFDAINYQGMGIWISSSVTFKNFTINDLNNENVSYYWMQGAIMISNGQTTMKECNGSVFENITINGSGNYYGLSVDNLCNIFTVNNCTFNNLSQAIYVENSGGYFENITITDNKFIDCSFAFHGSYSGSTSSTEATTSEVLTGSFVFTENTLTGSDSLRCKVIVQDTNDTHLTKFTISDNTLTNAMIGTVNLQYNGEVNDVLNDNDLDENSYIVTAVEPGTITFYSSYQADPDSHGRWVFTNIGDGIEDYGNEAGTAIDYVKSAIDEANESYSNTLSITVNDSGDLIKTFTWFKDAIYWVGTDTDVEEPDITKTVDQSEVYVGDTVTFTLTSNVPEYLGIYMASAIKDIANDAYDENENGTLEDSELTQDYYLTFHDTMDYGDNLIVDEDSFVVTVNGVSLTSDQYTLSTSNDDGCSYHITLNLTALCTAGVFSEDDIENSPAIVVTYTATVAEDADLTSYVNTAWVSFEDETSGTATAEVTVVEVESESEDEPNTPDTTVEPTEPEEETDEEAEANEEEVETETSDNTVIYMYATLGLLAAGGYLAITKKNLLRK